MRNISWHLPGTFLAPSWHLPGTFLLLLFLSALSPAQNPAFINNSDGFDTVQIAPGTVCGVGQGRVACVPLLGCLPPAPNLPAFPAITTTGSYACISNCQLPPQTLVAKVSLGAPVLLGGDIYNISLSATIMTQDGVPDIPLSGLIEAKYARAWKITSPPWPNGGGGGCQPIWGQVWRFLINVDATLTTAQGVTTPCPVPSCCGSSLVHWVGHIDYAMVMSQPCAQNPTTAQWFHALSLSHLPGCISHNSLSTRPLTGPPAHLGQSYHLVTPAPFVWQATNPPLPPPTVSQPTFCGDDIRFSTLFPLNITIEREQSIICVPPSVASDLSIVSPTCLCSSLDNPIWFNMNLSGAWTVLRGAWCCGFQICNSLAPPPGFPCAQRIIGNFASMTIPGWPTGPNGLVGLNLGHWNLGNVFPFDQSLSIFWGGFEYANEPCLLRASSSEFITGVATSDMLNGMNSYRFELFPSRLVWPPVGCQGIFVDFQNSKILQDGLHWVPTWGSQFRADIVLSLNIF